MNMKDMLVDIIRCVYSVDGDVFGGYVRDSIVDADCNIRDLDVRVDPDKVSILTNMLSTQFEIGFNAVSTNYRTMGVISYSLSPKDVRDSNPLKMDVLACTSAKWQLYPCDFDVNQLAKNSNSMFVRPFSSSCLLFCNNRYDAVVGRCNKKRFALLALPANIFADTITLLVRSKDLVGRGWVMDDHYLGNKSWVFSTWSSLCENASNIRKKRSDSALASLTSQHDCCLCHEKFQNDDVVINTCCNHNFHWVCNNTNEASGLLNWFKIKQSFACPMCRQNSVVCLLPYGHTNFPIIDVATL